jgi:hypothetical protein
MLSVSKPDCNEAELQQSGTAGLDQHHISMTGTMQDRATEVHIAV